MGARCFCASVVSTPFTAGLVYIVCVWVHKTSPNIPAKRVNLPANARTHHLFLLILIFIYYFNNSFIRRYLQCLYTIFVFKMCIQALSDVKYFIVKPVFSIGLRVILAYKLWHWHINFNDTQHIILRAMSIYRCFIVAVVCGFSKLVLLSWRVQNAPHRRFDNIVSASFQQRSINSTAREKNIYHIDALIAFNLNFTTIRSLCVCWTRRSIVIQTS